MKLKEWNRFVGKKAHIPLSVKWPTRRLNGIGCPKCGAELFDDSNSLPEGLAVTRVHCDNCEYQNTRAVEYAKEKEFNITEGLSKQDIPVMNNMFREHNKETIKNIQLLKEKRWNQSKIKSLINIAGLSLGSFSTISGLVYLYTYLVK